MVTPDPPDPFTPAPGYVPALTTMWRVHNRAHRATEFNPGLGARTRFAFFGDPVVPILYAAETEVAAIAESLLHDIPAAGGVLLPEKYEGRVLSPVVTTRSFKVALFYGVNLRRIKIEAADLTASRPTSYGQTVKYAQAAHEAGFDGVAWMSRLANDSGAVALFGDRVAERDLVADPERERSFTQPEDVDWLTTMCAPLHIDVSVRREL